MKNKVMKQASVAALVLAGFMISAPVLAEETTSSTDSALVKMEDSTSNSSTTESSSSELSTTEESTTAESSPTSETTPTVLASKQAYDFKGQGATSTGMFYQYGKYQVIFGYANGVNTVVIIDPTTKQEIARSNEQFGYGAPMEGVDPEAQEQGIAAAKKWVVSKVDELEQNPGNTDPSDETPTNPSQKPESEQGKESTDDKKTEAAVASTQQSSQQASVTKSAKVTSSDTKKLPNTGMESSFLVSVVGVITIMLGAIVASFSLKNKKN